MEPLTEQEIHSHLSKLVKVSKKNWFEQIRDETESIYEKCLTISAHSYNKNPLLYQQIIEYLLNKGTNINCTGLYGWTSLSHAVCEENLPLIEFLLNHGANINESNLLQSTYNCEILEYLLKRGCVHALDDAECLMIGTWIYCGILSDETEIKMEINKLFELIELFLKYGARCKNMKNQVIQSYLWHVNTIITKFVNFY